MLTFQLNTLNSLFPKHISFYLYNSIPLNLIHNQSYLLYILKYIKIIITKCNFTIIFVSIYNFKHISIITSISIYLSFLHCPNPIYTILQMQMKLQYNTFLLLELFLNLLLIFLSIILYFHYLPTLSSTYQF